MKLRRLLFVPLILCSVVHGLLMVQWLARWGFVGSIMHWFNTFVDPISAAAGFDLIICMLILGTWMCWREKRFTQALALTIIPFVIFPAVGFFLYLIISDKNLPGERLRDP